MSVKYTQSRDLRQYYAQIETLREGEFMRLQVGSFANRHATRKGSHISNGQILQITENGSPLQNIPARPVLRPVVDFTLRDEVNKVLTRVAFMLARGSFSSYKMQQLLGGLGAKLQKEIVKLIDKGGYGHIPLSPVTLRLRKMRGVRSTKALVESGQFRASIKYRIVKNYD